MSHIQHTPESLIPRSDSKNPAATCRGLTTAGRPCRRAIAQNSRFNASSPTRVEADSDEISSTTVDDNEVNSYFCWQHKNQAPRLERVERKSIPLQARNSVDTLVSRLGLLDITAPVAAEKKGHTPAPKASREKRPQSRPKGLSRPSLFSFLCCGACLEHEDDYLEVVRHRKRTSHNPKYQIARDAGIQQTEQALAYRQEQVQAAKRSSAPQHNATSTLSPSTLPANIASQVLAEASKPISPSDKAGYIYMYWLTQELLHSPTEVSSFLDLPSPTRHHRASAQYVSLDSSTESPSGLAGSGKNMLTVKIGRATNVHRRLSSWQQQCGYNLSLIRFYPYVPSNSPPIIAPPGENNSGSSPTLKPGSPGIRKVPYSHRVERLIHLELSEMRVKQEQCTTCGKAHREWFEIQATKEAVRYVDGVIRRWVLWAEQLAQVDQMV